ncbi:MAG TPA: nitroreductase family protein [Clostridiales bacterium]|jgi:nitroreductase|nr:nitroreductase family protein [Clostridiales bacterium]
MNALFKRRSIRKYIDKEVSDADLELLLKAAMCAPSAGNEQPWEFIVVRDREIMKRVSEFHPYSKMLHQASAAIVVCGNRSRQVYDRDYWQLDCSAATQNILIQATDMKIGSVWLAVYPEPDRIKGAKKLFGLPEEVIPLAIVSLGYPQEEKKMADRFKQERIHYNIWGGKKGME